MPSTLQVVTLGCSKNTVDTEHLLSRLKGRYEILPSDHSGRVDVLLVNTCGFIGDAKEESIGAIMQAVGRKEAGDVGELLVFGCLSQRYMAEMPGLVPEVDGWYGARTLDPLVEHLGGEPGHETERIPEGQTKPYAYLKISEGCDRRCSYCAIPLIRGPHKSVPMELLAREAGRLADGGVKELILIAQDTTYYGLDLYHRRALADLLARLSAIDGIERIRIHYSYPADFPEDVLDQMAGNPKVCRYMDIPLQHISDKVLSNMHRGVDGAWTRDLIRRMRERVPGLALRTTMIVGHPGEGEAEFEELLSFVKKARFERLGAFAYSEEEGTWGAKHLKDEVPASVKEERLARLMEVQRGISEECCRGRIGTVEKVLVDGYEDGDLVCRSEFESPEVDGEIRVPCGPESATGLLGNFTNVRITGAGDYDLSAELMERP